MSDHWANVMEDMQADDYEQARRFTAALLLARSTGFIGLTLPSVEARVQQLTTPAELQPPLPIYKYWPTKEALVFTYLEKAMEASLLRANDIHSQEFSEPSDDPHHVPMPDTKNFRYYIELYAQSLCWYLSFEREFVWEALTAAFTRMPLYGVRLQSLRGAADVMLLDEADFTIVKDPPEPQSLVGFARRRSLIEEPGPEVFDSIRLVLWSYTWAVVLSWYVDTTPKLQATSDFIAQTARVPATVVQSHWMLEMTDIEPYLLKGLWAPVEKQLGGVWMPTAARRILDTFVKPAGGVGFLDTLPFAKLKPSEPDADPDPEQ